MPLTSHIYPVSFLFDLGDGKFFFLNPRGQRSQHVRMMKKMAYISNPDWSHLHPPRQDSFADFN